MANNVVHLRLRRTKRAFRATAAVAVTVLMANLLQWQPAAAGPKANPLLGAQNYTSVAGHPVTPKARRSNPAPGQRAASPAQWPAAASAETTVEAGSGASIRAGSLPVLLSLPTSPQEKNRSAPGKVRATILPQSASDKAGVNGVIMRLERTDGITAAGSLHTVMDYSGFSGVYGGVWASRLRLVTLPECALTTPDKAGCGWTELATQNDSAAQTLSADVTVPATSGTAFAETKDQLAGNAAVETASGVLVAAVAGASGGAGDFSATSLASTATWSHGGSTGGFNWSYPLRMPPGVGGPAAEASISYSSQSIDGRMASTNNQVGWIGSGFSYDPGYIERRYKSCADDMTTTGANNTVKTGDLCWGTDNAILNLNGSVTELLKGSDGKWHPVHDDGSKIELLTNTSFSNGDDNNEYWKVTDTRGSVYWFGRHRLPGWTSGKAETNSVLTVPIAGNNPNEPCNKTAFKDSFCDQGWRWQLDYVEDLWGNTMSYWYARDKGYYARNLDPASLDDYYRDGYLQHIDYGTDNRTLVNSVATDSEYVSGAVVPSRVDFTVADRCLSACATHDAQHWPDTPWDQECVDGQTDCRNASPTFWSTKRLTTITTKVWNTTTAAWKPVDSWTLRQSFPDQANDGGLWLDGITHTGLVGGTLATPEVTFSGIQMYNRVDATQGDWAPAMNWRRVNSIVNETGGQLWITYSSQQCAKGGTMPTAVDNNSLRCYPVKWTPPGYTDPITDYFHKYVVTEVRQIDALGLSPDIVTAYTYNNPDNLPLWHYDDPDGLTKTSNKTWSEWRGYPSVTTTVGTGADQTTSQVYYYRGMHGDKLANGGTRTATLLGTEQGTVGDEEAFAGQPFESIQYLDGAILSSTMSFPTVLEPATATRTIDGRTVTSQYVRPSSSWSRTKIDSGWRRSSSSLTYDSYGLVVSTESASWDNNGPAVTQCTHNEYRHNTAANIIGKLTESEGWIGTCDTPPTDPANITSITRNAYDGGDIGAAITKGAVTRIDGMSGWANGGPTFQTTGTAGYDAAGRIAWSTDISGEKTSVAYTPAIGGPITRITTTYNAMTNWSEYLDIEPGWGSTLVASDINTRKTTKTYDPLGRLLKVWQPGRTTSQTPHLEYAYSLDQTKAKLPYTTTKTLNANGAQESVYQIFDSWGRVRETQTAAIGSGRILTDTFYDSLGRAFKNNNAVWDGATAPNTTLSPPLDADVAGQTRTEYDHAGRPTASVFYSKDTAQWRTTTEYHGDHIAAIPPVPGTAGETWTNAQGQTTQVRSYHTQQPTGVYDTTSYTYWPTGQAKTVTDPGGNQWSYTYDDQGRLSTATDPDKGLSSISYNSIGDVETTKDANGNIIAYTYGPLGRVDTIRDGSTTGPIRVAYTYDSPAKGLTSTVTRYYGTDAFVTKVVAVDALYRPTQTQITLPSSYGTLATAPYVFKASYAADGSPQTNTLPAAGGLNAEVLTYEYDSTMGMPLRLKTDYNTGTTSYYVSDASYTNFGEVNTITRSTALTGAPAAQTAQYYDEVYHRVRQRAILKTTGVAAISDAAIKYDTLGNVTKIDDNPAGGQRDTQCFSYDWAQRLTEAWTPASYDCAQAPSTNLGGPAKYWLNWGIDNLGNRTTQTEHATQNGDITTTYAIPTSGNGVIRPHAMTGFTRTDGKSAQYAYDAVGNMTCRPDTPAASNNCTTGAGSQKLEWDAEGHLTKLTDAAGVHSYLYDAGGARLVTDDPNAITVHLGGMELTKTKSTGAITATRYYTFNGEVVAQRTTAGLSWLASDTQGTSQVAITADTNQTVTQRRQTPYGTPRGTNPTWVNPKGYLGGQQDPTGLTHLGAREYDPNTGRFISVDPVVDFGDTQQMNGYAYANNSPVTSSDPSGLIPEDFVPHTNPDGSWYSGFCGAGDNPYDCWQDYNAGTLIWNCEQIAKCRKNPGWHDGLDIVTFLATITGAGPVATLATAANANIYCWEGPASDANCEAYTDAVIVDLVSFGEGGELALIGRAESGAVTVRPWESLATSEKVAALESQAKIGLTRSEKLDQAAADALTAEKSIAREGTEAKKIQQTIHNTPTPPKTPPKPPRRPTGKTPGSQGAKCPHSFDPDTEVLMADGTTKAIKDVQIGDRVLATDPTTGETKAQLVTDLHNNDDRDLADVAVRDNRTGDETVLHTTWHHPFWNATTGGWSEAKDLKAGDQLRDAEGNATQTVADIEITTGQRWMRDLTVGDIHTYYVVAGRTPVLVHNCGPAETVINLPETTSPRPLKPAQVDQAWSDFLGPGDWTNIHPRTGVADPNRLVSADGLRSIRVGRHEMNSKPTKFHYHEETWDFITPSNTWVVSNNMVRVPLK